MLSNSISVALKFESNLKDKNFPLLSLQTSEKWKYSATHKGHKDKGVVPLNSACQQRQQRDASKTQAKGYISRNDGDIKHTGNGYLYG